MYHLSYPLKEPGGHRLPAGRSGDALPGPHQAAWARVCAGGGSQGTSHKKNTTNIFSLFPQFHSFHFYLNRNGRASCRPPLWRKSWRAPQSKRWSFIVQMYSFYRETVSHPHLSFPVFFRMMMGRFGESDIVHSKVKTSSYSNFLQIYMNLKQKPQFRGIFWVICSSQQRETRSTLCWITPPTSWT